MASLLEALYFSDPATWLRHGRWSYALVNASHVLGIALLIGAIVPLNLRLLGCWRSIPLTSLTRVLVPSATMGLVLALVSGSLLFASRAPEYAGMKLFLLKVALLSTAVLHALWRHRKGWDDSTTNLSLSGVFSITLWLAVLICGRLLAFVEP